MRWQQLEASYRATRYQVVAPGGDFELHIDQYSPELAALLKRESLSQAAYLSACNPASEAQPAAHNLAATARLECELQAIRQPWFSGQAIDPEGIWLPEPSFLVLGIDAATAVSLGRRYGQYAILLAGPDAIPRLEWLIKSVD